MSGETQLPGGTIMPIGHVASQNIQAALKTKGIDVGAEIIEKFIRDEINVMSAHFQMAVSEVQAQYEAEVLKMKHEVAEIRAAWTYVKANRIKVLSVLSSVAGIAAAIGHFV